MPCDRINSILRIFVTEIAANVMAVSLDVMVRTADVMENWFVVIHASLLVMERVLIIGWKRLPIVDIQPDLAYLQLSIIVARPNVLGYQRYPIDFKQSPRYLVR